MLLGVGNRNPLSREGNRATANHYVERKSVLCTLHPRGGPAAHLQPQPSTALAAELHGAPERDDDREEGHRAFGPVLGNLPRTPEGSFLVSSSSFSPSSSLRKTALSSSSRPSNTKGGKKKAETEAEAELNTWSTALHSVADPRPSTRKLTLTL